MAKRIGINEREVVEVSQESVRPKDLLFQSTEKEEYTRVTYYSTKVLKRAYHVYSTIIGKDKSVLFREIMTEAIPEQFIQEAEKWVKENKQED